MHDDSTATPACTRDFLFDGNIVLNQPKYGYRFSMDTAALSLFLWPKPGQTILDLGTGCGVIPIILAHRFLNVRVIGVEIQPSLCHLAKCNVVMNHMEGRIRIIGKDMNQLRLVDVNGPVDLVVANPPYGKRDSGRINPDSERAIARHELKIDLGQLLQTAQRMLCQSGQFLIVYPSARTVDLLSLMRSSGIEPKAMTSIHIKPKTPARRVVVVGTKGGRPGMDVGPPLYLYHDDGTVTHALQGIFGPRK